VEISPELGFEVGALSGTGFGVIAPASGTALWAAPHAGARGAYPLTDHLELVVVAHGVVPVTRESFVISGLGEVHRPPAVTVRAGLGLEVRLP
jgi:hypothetical protein